MTQSYTNPDQADLGYGQILTILWRRRFWFLGVFCGVLAVAVPVALTQKSTYESSMQLLVEPNYQESEQTGGEEEQFIDSGVEVDYATQLNLMRSSGLLQKAVDRLQSEYPTLEVETLQESLALRQLMVDDEVQTKIFQIDYSGEDPVETQRVLEELQKVYQEYNLQQQEQRLNEGLSFINDQLPTVRESLVKAEETLKQFRTTYSLIAPEEEANGVVEDLKTLQQERESLRAEYQDTLARYNNLEQSLGSSSQNLMVSTRLSESSRYQTLLNKLQETELALAEHRARFTDANPVLQDLLEQQQNQRKLLQEEVEQVLGQIPAQLDVTEEALQKQGQLGETDLELAGALVEAQSNLLSLQARDRSLAQTEDRFRTELKRFPELIAQYNSLLQEVEVKRNTLQQLLEARQELGIELARGGFKWQVVEPPLLGEEVGPSTKKNLLLGVVVGLFLGSVAAFGREVIDDAVRTSEQLKGQVALPLLGATPKLPQPETGFLVNLPWRLARDTAPSTLEIIQWIPFRESLDLIYKNIQLLNSGPALSSLIVTSALPGEGKSTLVVGLALSASRLHQRVLIVDADLRCSTLHEQLDLPNDEGLSTLLTGETEIPRPHRFLLANSSIDVLTAGPMPTDPVKLLSSQRMKELMEAFERSYDLVLLDTPPVLGTVDAIQAASYCSGVVLVGRLDRVTQSELGQASALLSKLNAIGIIANGARDALYSYMYQADNNHKVLPRQSAAN